MTETVQKTIDTMAKINYTQSARQDPVNDRNNKKQKHLLWLGLTSNFNIEYKYNKQTLTRTQNSRSVSISFKRLPFVAVRCFCWLREANPQMVGDNKLNTNQNGNIENIEKYWKYLYKTEEIPLSV